MVALLTNGFSRILVDFVALLVDFSVNLLVDFLVELLVRVSVDCLQVGFGLVGRT